jgi:hypothetical protein
MHKQPLTVILKQLNSVYEHEQNHSYYQNKSEHGGHVSS